MDRALLCDAMIGPRHIANASATAWSAIWLRSRITFLRRIALSSCTPSARKPAALVVVDLRGGHDVRLMRVLVDVARAHGPSGAGRGGVEGREHESGARRHQG